ncbi:MBL fold metallo-hydrolase [Salinimicrobium soli]|uniref:MBL fold metallo-hydrolase n=1 Tax=Salinimicrobium soli TaxID=1254399 RepID=UPI003AAFF80A
MKLKILGTRGKVEPSAPHHKNYSGILIDDKILVDIGEKQYLENNPKAIVFTHFHPDHAFFVFDNEKFTPEIPLFGPEKNELIPDLKVISGKFEVGTYSFTPVPVIHALSLKSCGYLIEKNGKKIFITGDVAWIEKANFSDFPKIDLVITEASFVEKGGRINRKGNRIFGHTGIPNLINLLKPVTDKIVFTHYGNWFFEDISEAKKKIKALSGEIELICAHDGMELEI